jgi:succinoglycan biosynthesis protein ExoV
MLVDAGADSDRRIVGFMPHFESAADGAWRQAAQAASVTLIDPRDDTAAILAAIGRCRVLLSEAMHGAIVADAMRVPWVALRPLMPIHRAKWHDWADALDMQVHFQALAASTLPERLRATPIVRFHRGRRLLQSVSARLAVIARSRFVDRAASALATAARAPAQLSPDAALDRCRARMMERIHALALHPRRTCAYHG